MQEQKREAHCDELPQSGEMAHAGGVQRLESLQHNRVTELSTGTGDALTIVVGDMSSDSADTGSESTTALKERLATISSAAGVVNPLARTRLTWRGPGGRDNNKTIKRATTTPSAAHRTSTRERRYTFLNMDTAEQSP